MKIDRFTGETIKLETSVMNTDGTAANLTGVVAKFAYRLKEDRTPIIKECVVTSNKLSITLLPSETLVAGEYEYEFRIKLNGEEDSIDQGTITLTESLIKGL